jgi:hypothetical protein
MKLFLATKLTVEECKERLHNAIDPVPTPEERMNTVPNTTWAPNPLPSAGGRVTGFGYSPGTRPVVGSIQDNTFDLEKLIVQSGNRNGPNAPPSIGPHCTGRLQSAPYGTLIEIEVERPISNIVLVFVACLFAVLFGVVGFLVLYTYFTTPPTSKGGVFDSCMPVLVFAAPLVLTLIAQQTGKAESEYLLKFVRIVCQASSLSAWKRRKGEGYTGKTQHLG